MIDTHAHIDSIDFKDDIQEVIDRAFNSGVEKIIIPAIESNLFDSILKLCNENENIYCSMGVHPHNALEFNKEISDLIKSNCKNEKVLAIGEIGLDYYYDFCPKEVQKEVFVKQIRLAKELALPIIVHNRDSDEDLYEILKSESNGNLTGVLHCFSSDKEFMKKAIDLGFYISFTGNITFKKSNLFEVIKEVPSDRFLLETDSPYMTPVPLRGKRNEPYLVKKVAEKVAEIKEISIDEVIKMTTKNAKTLFKFLTIFLFFLVISDYAFSDSRKQKQKEEDYYAEDDSLEFYNPYKKVIGLGPMLGTNTVVETYYLNDNDKDISREGIFAYGGSIIYYLTDYLSLEANYLYSKDMKIVEQFNNQIDPNIYQVYELTSHWFPNPYNIINFYGTIGGTFFQTSINTKKNTDFGINFGIGFLANLQFDKVGVIGISAEWRLDWGITKSKSPYMEFREGQTIITEKDRTVFYSIPRFGIFWFPEFSNGGL